MIDQFLSVEFEGDRWRIVCPSLGNLIIFEHQERQVVEDQLDHYTRLIAAHKRWERNRTKRGING